MRAVATYHLVELLRNFIPSVNLKNLQPYLLGHLINISVFIFVHSILVFMETEKNWKRQNHYVKPNKHANNPVQKLLYY